MKPKQLPSVSYLEIGLHTIFWILIIVGNIQNNTPTFETDESAWIILKFVGRWLPMIILLYINISYLIPQFLGQKKYRIYLGLLFLLWALGTPVQVALFNQVEQWTSYVAAPNEILPFSTNSYLLSFFFLGITMAINLLFRYISQQRDLQRMQTEQLYTELALLRNQINPHFFFNTLNNLHGLILEKSEEASYVVTSLSQMMRYSLYECTQNEVPIKKEIDYIQHYIHLQKIRLRYPVRIRFESKAIVEGGTIAPLMLIVFVENAFKHGVDKQEKNAFVDIDLWVKPTQIHFRVTNNYTEVYETSPSGLGLTNVKRRLELLYPNKHELTYLRKDGLFEVNLKIDILKGLK